MLSASILKSILEFQTWIPNLYTVRNFTILLMIKFSKFVLQHIKKYVNSENYSRLKLLFSSSVGFAKQPPPPLYIITPTWARPVQISELTRLGYTLKVLKILKILKKYHIL